MPQKNNRAAPAPRVVRAAPPPKKRRRKRPLSKGARITRKILGMIGKLFMTMILVFVITGCIVGTALTVYVVQYIDTESPIDLNNLEMSYTSIVYGLKDGENVEVQRLHREENRIWVDLRDIPQALQDAVVYTEDERFYEHTGVDFKRTIAAFANEILRILGRTESRFGGSTITQQLIKNINGDINSRGVDEKIQEIMQAMNMERKYSKPQILEAYLNYIGLHFNTVGVQAGANLYFGKDVSELSIAECASLAVISKNPSNYNPISNPEENKRRRDYALEKMLDFGKITRAEYEEALATPIQTVDSSKSPEAEDNKTSAQKNGVYGYYTDAVIEAVVQDLMKEYGYKKDFAEQKLMTSGYRIYTVMDVTMQTTLERMFADPATFAYGNAKEEDIPQAAMVICDYEGNILALVGGRGEKTTSRGFNLATQAKRPFGSTIKPLSIYGPAFEKDLITWSTLMEDKPTLWKDKKDELAGNPPDYPNNYNHRFEENPMTIIDAIKVSKNTIPVQLCELMGPETVYEFMTTKLHFSNMVASAADIGSHSMALGGADTTLIDLTAAYQIFGNNGYYTPPKLYSQVLDAEGKVILDNTSSDTKQVIPADTAYVLNRALWQVVNGGGSGARAKLSQWETVGKTGTSDDRKDLLFAGCTPYYTAVIRYGHNDNTVISNSVEGSHIQAWKKVMEEILKGKNPATFDLDSSGVEQREYCTESGLLATSQCPAKLTGYYKKDFLPEYCSHENLSAPEEEDPFEDDPQPPSSPDPSPWDDEDLGFE